MVLLSSLLPLLLQLLALSAASNSTTSETVTNTSSQNVVKYSTSSDLTGIISIVAGYNSQRSSNASNGVAAYNAALYSPVGVTLDKEENCFISVSGFNIIQKVTMNTGIITTVAGTGRRGYSGDESQAISAKLNGPRATCLDTSGNIFIADTRNHRIRKVTVSTGIITTVAGNGVQSFEGDNAAATSSCLNYPMDVAVDTSGNIFIADNGNSRIRKVTAITGMITTIAGSGISYCRSMPKSSATPTEYCLGNPYGVTLDTSGNLFIASDPCIFKLTASTSVISVVAGIGPMLSGSMPFNGDDILATTATLSDPRKVAFDASGNMFIADTSHYRIRKVTASTGMIVTVAGTGTKGRKPLDDGGRAILTTINSAGGIAVDALGNFYITDFDFDLVRKVTFTAVTPSTPATSAPTSPPSINMARTVTPSTSISTAPAPRATSPPSISGAPAAVTPSTSISKVPSTSSSTELQSSKSASAHTYKAVYATFVSLSSVLILHLCRDA